MTGEHFRTSASLFVKAELEAKKEVGQSHMRQAQVRELGLWLWWIVESLSNELYSLGWPGSLVKPPASASASRFDCGTLSQLHRI